MDGFKEDTTKDKETISKAYLPVTNNSHERSSRTINDRV